MVELLRHARWAEKNPQIMVIRTANHHIAVGIIQPDNPIVGFDAQSLRKLYFQLGIRMFSVMGIGESFSNSFVLDSFLKASVINSDGAISIQWVICNVSLASILEYVLDSCLLVPSPKVTSNIDVGHCFWRIFFDFSGFVVEWCQNDSRQYYKGSAYEQTLASTHF